MAHSRKKVLIIGATGFVGRRFCLNLLRHNYQDQVDLTLTARDADKFSQIFKDFPPSNESYRFETLDTLDQSSINRIVRQNQIVCNFVGPYAHYAPHIIKACAESGSHYIDITGEVNFIREMMEKYDEVAKKSGASIIPFCGFDSIPSDIGVYLVKKRLIEKYKSPVKKVHIVYKAKGGFNGGTIASAFESISKINKKEMENLHFLCPKEREYYSPIENEARLANNGSYVAPFFMEQINNKVVYRTKHLAGHDGYAKNFIYLESMFTTAKLSFLSSQIMEKSLDFSNLLMKSKRASKLVRKFLPAPGEGPSEQVIQNGFFEAQVTGISESGQKEEFSLLASGDPGNKVTASLALLSLKCLCEIDTPRPGFQTPVSCFGDMILSKLNDFNFKIKEI